MNHWLTRRHAWVALMVLGLPMLLARVSSAQNQKAGTPPAPASPASVVPQREATSDARFKDPTLSIEVVGEGTFESTTEAAIRVTLKNNETEMLLCVNDIEIWGPSKFAPGHFTFPHDNDTVIGCLDPGTQYPVTQRFGPAAGFWDLWLVQYGYKEPRYTILSWLGPIERLSCSDEYRCADISSRLARPMGSASFASTLA